MDKNRRDEIRAEIADCPWDYEVDVEELRALLDALDRVEALPDRWQQINSGTGEYWVASRKVADQCARELKLALTGTTE